MIATYATTESNFPGQSEKLLISNLQVSNILTSISWPVTLSWLEDAYSRPLFQRAILAHIVGQSDLVFCM